MGSAWVVVAVDDEDVAEGVVGVEGVLAEVEIEGLVLWVVVRIEEVDGWWVWLLGMVVLGLVVERGILGVMERVMAWTLLIIIYIVSMWFSFFW